MRLMALALLFVTACAESRVEQRSRISEVSSTGARASSASGARIKSSAPSEGATATQEGKASWYGKEQHGGPTASGERFNMHELTAAHRTLRFNTRVRVTNLKNGRQVVVRINDRGPYGRGRIIDVSRAAAEQLQMIDAGVVPVRLEVLR